MVLLYISDTAFDIVIPYITLGVTDGVVTQSVPSFDDGTSLQISVLFPLGNQFQSTVYVSHEFLALTVVNECETHRLEQTAISLSLDLLALRRFLSPRALLFL